MAKKLNIYEVTRQTGKALVKIERDLHEVGLHATAKKVNEAIQRLGWNMAEVVDLREKLARSSTAAVRKEMFNEMADEIRRLATARPAAEGVHHLDQEPLDFAAAVTLLRECRSELADLVKHPDYDPHRQRPEVEEYKQSLDKLAEINEAEVTRRIVAEAELKHVKDAPEARLTPDRSDAVNLARNVLEQRKDPEITIKGIVTLAQGVLDMDAWIREVTQPQNGQPSKGK